LFCYVTMPHSLTALTHTLDYLITTALSCPAGHLQEAQALSMSCGAPWRGGSLSGPTGGWGPLPVGTAAARVEEELRPEEQVGEGGGGGGGGEGANAIVCTAWVGPRG
jgi:hypothetical protein